MPLIKGNSKKVVSQNISEFHTGKTYAHTAHKFGAKKAHAQAIAVALSTARKYARKAEGGADLEDPRMKAIGIRPVEGTPDAPEQPVQNPPQGSWGPPVTAPAPQPAPSEDDLTKNYLKNLTGTETPASPGKIVSGMAHGLVDWVKGPGEIMKGPEQVQHATPGQETEEESFLQDLNNQAYDRQMTDFGAGTATGMIGASKFFKVPENAVGIGGGKLPQPQPFTHPKMDSHGEPVVISKPTPPTLTETWTNPSQTASFFAGQKTLPENLNGIPFESWKPPQDWVEHFDYNPVHVDEPAFQPDKTKKPASGVVILEPDGRVWLTAPTNQFGGYNASFPKGKMEGSLSMAENAIKEAYEETGLKVKIQSHLIDVNKDTSKTRYYLATREGGTPADMGWESQGLHVANINDVGKYLNKPADMQVIDALKNWAKEKAQPVKPSTEPQPTVKNAPDASGKYFGKYFHPYDLNPDEVKQFKFIKSNQQTGGTNPGGVYHAPDGTPVYIKQFEGESAIERTYNEKLANELLKLVDVPVANVRMTQLKGNPAIASDMVPGKELNTVSPTKYANLKGLREHYPAHLWTGNYDFVGTGKNNIMVMPNGQTIHIDPGGALRYRAQGKLKGPDMWGPNVEHFKMTPGKDLTDVMGEHYNNKPMMTPSAQRVANVTDQQIHDLVQQYGPLQKGEKAKLEETLKARRDGVAKMYGVDKGGTSAPPSTGPSTPSTGSVAPKPVPTTEPKNNPTLIKAQANVIFKNANGDPYKIAQKLISIEDKHGKSIAQKVWENLPEQVKADVGIHAEQIKESQTPPTAVGPGAPQTPAEVAQLASDKASAKFLLKFHHDDVGGIAKEVWDIANAIGPKSADNIVKHLPPEMYAELGDHLDALSTQHGVDPWKQTHEPPEYATWGDNPDRPSSAPTMDEGYKSSLGGDYDLKHHRNEWFHNLVNVPHSGLLPNGYAGLAYQTPGQLAQLLHNFDKFHKLGIIRDIDLQKYKPPTISDKDLKRIKPTKASFEHAIANGFAEWLTLFRGSKNIPGGSYPPFFRDPFQKKGSYKNERSIDLADQYKVADSYGGMYPSGPVMARSSKTLEFYWPNLIGKLYDKKNPGASYSSALKEGIIEAAHHNGYDLVIAHGMDDLGGSNQTQYMFLNTAGTLRAFSAALDPKHLRPALSEKAFQEARNPLLGLAGGTAFVYGALKGKGEDEKMARGGGTKFKPFSSIEIKPYRTPKTVIRPGAGKKAARTAKKLARGGASEPEPQEHEFINFAKGGMINSNIPGRTDKIPMKVSTGAYVLPADIPSALGQGNTMAGKTILDKMFNSGPYGLPLHKSKPAKFQMPHLKGFADGGETDHTPIIAAGGEYIIHPDEVLRQGNGSMTAGHKVLDKFVLHTRAQHIKTLKGLKPPK